MSHSSNLHLLLSDFERSYGAMEEAEIREFALAYSKGYLPHQRIKRERFPCDDTDPKNPSDEEAANHPTATRNLA